MGRTWLLAWLCVGCGADPQSGTIDAPHADAGPPRCFGDGTLDGGLSERIFLNFDGVTLHGGRDSSLTNTTGIIPQGADAVIPPFHEGRPDRAALIAQVTDLVVDALYGAGAAVEVTRTRPTDGDYIMIVIGGTWQDAMQTSASAALGDPDCSNLFGDDVGLVFENDNPILVATGIAFTIGVAVGLDPAKPVGNCMYPFIGSGTSMCTFTSAAQVYFVGISLTCNPDGTPQDQFAILRAAFGCP